MKTFKKPLLIITFLFMILAACDKDEKLIDPLPPTADFQTVDVNVILPEESNLDLTQTKLVSFLEEFDVSANGDTKAIHNISGRSLALLIDDDDDIVLMGFISDIKREISVKTSVETALYYGFGTAFLPEEIREKFFEGSNQLPGFDDFVNQAKDQFKSNNSYFRSDAFLTTIEEKLNALRYSADAVDIRKRTLLVDSGDVKSGLQIEEVDFESIRIVNTYRRRSHSFVYKTAFKNENGDETTIISDIVGENAAPKSDQAVLATGAIREFTGVLQDWAGGSGAQFASTSTDPIRLELPEEHSECCYKVRVIGPSSAPGSLTQIEEAKLRQLEYETLGYDLALPLLLDIVGHAELLEGLDETKFKGFIDGLIVFASSVPAVNKPLNNGDFKTALEELIIAMGNNFTGGQVEDMLKGLIDGVLESSGEYGSDYFSQKSDLIISRTEFLVKTLKYTDVLLKFVDYNRILSAITDSKPIEEWKVKVKKTKVTLSPKESVAFPFILNPIKAIIKDTELSSGQFFEFKWSTTGNYGILKDDVGHEGTAFSNTSTEDTREVSYFTEIDDDDLSEDAEDKIFVEAIIKENGKPDVSIGKDTAIVKIKPYKYQIRPDGATVKGNTNLALYIERPDGSEDITNNPNFDYKIVWTTQGRHGLFLGSHNNLTVYNENRTEYFCMDRKTLDGIEKVTARIYRKDKEENSDNYELFYEIEADIFINNDPNIFFVNVSIKEKIIGSGGFNIFSVFEFAPVPNAKSYKLEVVEYSLSTIPATLGNVHNWNVGDTDEPFNDDKTKYEIINHTSGVHISQGEAVADLQAYYGAIRGRAKVTVIPE